MQADIAFQNGGGIRSDLPAGNITYGNIVSLDPFDNTMCKIEATGAQILEMLTKCTRLVPQEDGSFPQCSGIKYTIHSASHTISDVAVLQDDGTYKPLDPAGKYTLAVSSYYKGGGYYDIFKDCRVLRQTGIITRDILSDYLEKTLNGKVPQAYAQPQGRITIVE
jgi:2',3'-cyclic-nucleotide 2'-phosphodiesterase (5'-nucleotidase family)